MTNTPSSEERDGEPLGRPIIDETHVFSPEGRYYLGEAFKSHPRRSVGFKETIGTKSHEALEDFIQAEGRLTPGTYVYRAKTGTWSKFSSKVIDDLGPMYFTNPWSIDALADQMAAIRRARLTPFHGLAQAANLDDPALKLPHYTLGGSPTPEHSDLRAYREGSSAYTPDTTPSEENQMPLPDPFNDTKSPAPAEETNEIGVSKLIQTRTKKTLHFRIEADPNVGDLDGGPCYKVLLPPTTSRVSQPPETRLREADVAGHLTRQHHFVDLAHQEITKRYKETQDTLSRLGDELDTAAANMRGLYQVRDEFLGQLQDRAEREAAEAEIERAKYRPAEPPHARSVWRPTLVTFMKHQLDEEGKSQRVRFTAVREIDESAWAIAGMGSKFTWDELLDWIQFEETDLDAVMNQVRYQHLTESVWYQAAKNDVVPGYGWREVRR